MSENVSEEYEPLDDQYGDEADVVDPDVVPEDFTGPTDGKGPDDE